MNDPQEIYLQPMCCADPKVGRLWSEHDPCEDWSDPDCDEKSTRYIRADLVNGRIADLETENERLREAALAVVYDECAAEQECWCIAQCSKTGYPVEDWCPPCRLRYMVMNGDER